MNEVICNIGNEQGRLEDCELKNLCQNQSGHRWFKTSGNGDNYWVQWWKRSALHPKVWTTGKALLNMFSPHAWKKDCTYHNKPKTHRHNQQSSDRDKDHMDDMERSNLWIVPKSEKDFSRHLDRYGRPFGYCISDKNLAGERSYLGYSRDSQLLINHGYLKSAYPIFPQVGSSRQHRTQSNTPLQTPHEPWIFWNQMSGYNHFRTPVQEIWREENHIRPQLPDEGADSKKSNRPLEINLEAEDFPEPDKISSVEDVMEDLQAATIWYCLGPDSIKNAARRQKVLNEPPNLMQKITISIIKTMDMRLGRMTWAWLRNLYPRKWSGGGRPESIGYGHPPEHGPRPIKAIIENQGSSIFYKTSWP